MKTASLLFTAALLLSGISIFAQDSKTGETNPFAKGNWSFDLNRMAAIQQINYFNEDNKLSEQTDADINIQGLYFLSNGFGLGLNFQSNSTRGDLHYLHSHTVGMKLQYGISVGNNSYLYARIGGGLGKGKVDIRAGLNQNYKFDIYNINAGIGFPIRLQKSGHTYLTPEISWDRNNEKDESRTLVENSFGIGLKLQTYLSHSELNCGKKIDASIIHRRYDRGSQFIDFNSSGLGSLTKQVTSYKVSPTDFKSDFSGLDLMVNYGYYILDNFAVGAGLGFNTSKKNNGIESTTTVWSFIPNLTFNLPIKNCWNNLFLNVEGGMRSSKSKADLGTGPYTYKEEYFTYGASLGFNYLLSSQIALTPKLGYSFKHFEDSRPSTYDARTPNASLGFRYIF